MKKNIFVRILAALGGIVLWLLALCALLCTATAADIWKKLMARKWLRVLLLAALLLISLAYITDATYSPFLYTQF